MKNRIREILTEKKVKALDLASAIGVSKVSIYNIINGKSEPSIQTLGKIASTLNVPLWSLFTSKEEVARDLELSSDAVNNQIVVKCPHCHKEIAITLTHESI